MEIIALFRELHLTLSVTVVLVTHTRQLVTAGMRAVEMADGRIVTPPPAPVYQVVSRNGSYAFEVSTS
jgi:ABC-type lipoprotein export system ATPase subunit